MGSALAVLVVAAPPVTRLIPPLGSAVEPLPHAPEAVQSARIGRIRVVDDAILDDESTHPRPLAEKSRHIDPSPVYILGGRAARAGWLPGAFASVVVFDAAFAQLLFGTEADAVVG